MEKRYQKEERIASAKKRVKRIKGFYSHLLVYVVINIMIVIINIQDLGPGESYFQYENFFTLFFWGIGLAVHGLSVFLPDFLLGQKWEERKIKELMDRDKKQWR